MLMEIFMEIISYLSILIPVLISIAMITILERKGLGSMQRRIGPNTVGIYGILQPISDGVKLILKEFVSPTSSYKALFIFAASISFLFSIIIWSVLPFIPGFAPSIYKLSILVFVVIGNLSIYSILLSGWAGNSKYGLLGSIRSSAQMISYELTITLILIVINIGSIYSFNYIILLQEKFSNWQVLLPVAIIYYISLLGETNRTPFDLPEAESELVSGFNTEYSSFPFALFFLAEYGNIIAQSLIFVLFFLGAGLIPYISLSPFFQFLIIIFKTILVAFSVIIIRGTLPRFRYDLLLWLAWNLLLPYILIELFTIIFTI